jgi:hypothetical protein
MKYTIVYNYTKLYTGSFIWNKIEPIHLIINLFTDRRFMADNIKIVVRVRPFNDNQRGQQCVV